MNRNDDPTSAAALPAATATTNPGFFTDGNPATGTPATVVQAEWANGVTEELIAVIVAASITPDKAVLNQLLQALLKMFGGAGVLGAAAGWMTLPFGLILQYASIAAPTGNGDVIDFPHPFPTACFGVVALECAASGWGSPPQPTIMGTFGRLPASFQLNVTRIEPGGPVYVPSDAVFYIALGN